jgi:hypothetical protein
LQSEKKNKHAQGKEAQSRKRATETKHDNSKKPKKERSEK